jgi:SSS family solute:Na+ symporter
MWARTNVAAGESGSAKMLMYLIDQKIPRPIGILLTFALLSSILSSTDTCLINASSIFVKDLLQRDSVRLIRITVCTIGAMATVIAVAGRGDIIALLSGAYSIYTSGVIFPLFIAIYFYGKRQLRTNIWIAAVSVGGICGLIGVYMPNTSVNFALIGMALSLVIAVMSVKRRVSSK